MSTKGIIIGIVLLAVLVLVYDATYGFKALMPGASGKPAGAWYPWNRTPQPDSYFARNSNGTVDYSRRADGTYIPLG